MLLCYTDTGGRCAAVCLQSCCAICASRDAPSLPLIACLAHLLACADDESSDEEGAGGGPPGSPLTQDMLQQVFQRQGQQGQQGQQQAAPQAAPHPPPAQSSSSRGGGSWLRGFSGSVGGGEGGSALDEASSVISLGDLGAEAVSVRQDGDECVLCVVIGAVNRFLLCMPPPLTSPGLLYLLLQADAPPAGTFKQGVFVTGRLSDFELTGERGTKCPNLRCAGWWARLL